MEEEKAAAYYDELTRKGEGAARFKQGLGFSSGADSIPEKGSTIPSSSSSFLNQFVKAASNPKSTENESEIRSVRDKLNKKKKPEDHQHSRVSERSYREKSSERRRYRSRERDEKYRRRSRSRSADKRSRYGDRDRDSHRRRRSRSRSLSPRREHGRIEDERRGKRREDVKEKKIDYSKLIKGYDEMSAAEKVKAKMKLQLDETAKKDTVKGPGWERFEFDKDAPVDDEEVEEGTDDDAALVKRMGQSFRFSAIEAKREEEVKAAHDEAMFGVPTYQTPNDHTDDDVTETSTGKDDEGDNNNGGRSLLSEKVLAKQQGSWRDRARKS